MRTRMLLGFVVVTALAGCAGERWPEPPAVDAAQYQKEHAAWRDEHRAGLSWIVPIVGIWPLPEGETAFGADETLPVALAKDATGAVPARAGVFTRAGDRITVTPAAGATLTLEDGTRVASTTETGNVMVGPIALNVTSGGDDRRWVMAVDTSHPAMKNPPPVESFPLDPRWRVAARFESFDRPKPVEVPDVRGGTMQFSAVGELRFRLQDRELRLTAFGEEGREAFFVMFKDPTNQSTTYAGYRMLSPKAVSDGEWTVLDFNFADNPPCAYSRFTTCPLPPPENRLPIAVEAGLKRLPSVQGYSPAS